MNNDIDQFNSHQQDVRNRATSLVRAILLIAGGALTVSIGIFMRGNSPELSPSNAQLLRIAWGCLFSAIVFLISSLVIIIARDYAFGERWRLRRAGKNIDTKERILWIEALVWGTALIGYGGFLVGMLSLAVVAASIIGHA